MLYIQCSMGQYSNAHEIPFQDCHIICSFQNVYKVLQITLNEWLVITLGDITYLNNYSIV